MRSEPTKASYGIKAAVLCLLLVGLSAATARADPEVCNCPFPGNPDGMGVIDIVDLVMIIRGVFDGGPIVTDPNCPKARSDFNADGAVDVRDVVAATDYLFTPAGAPVNPCDCPSNPALCAPVVDHDPGVPGNAVVVESKTVVAGQTGVVIGVKLTNDVPLRHMVIPLIAREITPGSFFSTVVLSPGERLGGGQLSEISSRNQYADPDGTCGVGGFKTVTFSRRGTSPPLERPVEASPEGFLFDAGRLSGLPLDPGTDVTGSITFTVSVTNTPGMFEIDTICTDPVNHLMFVQDDAPANTPIVPTFTKGVITIVENTSPVAQCQNRTVSAESNCLGHASVNNGSYDPDGGPVNVTETPAGPYPPGATAVTLIVTDNVGAADTCQATVTVVDNTPPTVVCPSSVPIGIGPADTGAYVNYAPSITDNCPGGSVACVPPSGSFFPRGLTPVICVATDAAGLADTCTFSVVVFTECFDRLSDMNCDGVTNVLDIVLLTNITFRGADPAPPCPTPK